MIGRFKIIFCIIFSLCLFSCNNEDEVNNKENTKTKSNTAEVNAKEKNILKNKIYFFYQDGCYHCHDAIEYIESNYKDLPLIAINIADKSGYKLFIKCVEKFNLGNRVGTPLFWMNDNFVMGWSAENKALFDEYVKDFIK